MPIRQPLGRAPEFGPSSSSELPGVVSSVGALRKSRAPPSFCQSKGRKVQLGSGAPVGPGPNRFSDSDENVFVDKQGRLHLRITQDDGRWRCAEVVSNRSFGLGTYGFTIDSGIDDFDPNVVLGLFTWSDDPAYAHREIDIECSRWGNGADMNNAQFVVQPFDTVGHLARYAVPAGLTNTTHLFVWETNQVNFQCQIGGFDPAPVPVNEITNWSYTLSVPQTGDENVRINFWLFNGNPPVGNSELEFIIKSFEFVPLGSAQPAVLSDINIPADGSVQFNINGQTDWRYDVQASTNLQQWQDLGTILATNNAMPFVDNSSAGLGARFFRVVTLP